MNFLSNVVGYSGKLFFATIMFFAMIISTVVSLPFIGAGMIKDAINAHHHHQAEESNLIDEYSEYWYILPEAKGVRTGGSYPFCRYRPCRRLCAGCCLPFAWNEVICGSITCILLQWPHFQSCLFFLRAWPSPHTRCGRRSCAILSKKGWWARLSSSCFMLLTIQ